MAVNEPNKTWPPAPAEPGQSGEVPKCPNCGRKLLTVGSILCNWCGAAIDDEEHQKRAAEERARVDAELKHRLEIEQQETARYGVLGRLKKVKREPRATDILADLAKEPKQR